MELGDIGTAFKYETDHMRVWDLVLKPGESHTYTSGCQLTSPFGAMSGYYDMINFTSTRKFKVNIPSFKLSAPFALN